MGEHQAERPVVNIVGDRVALGPLRRDLAPLFRRWWNDFATQHRSGFPDPPEPWTADRVNRFLEDVSAGQRRFWFVIYEIADWRPIGYTNLRDIDDQHGTAEFGITIGDRADRGKGYGTEATRLILDYAFTVLGLNNVLLDTMEYNRAAIRAYEKAGFREVGRRYEAAFAGGRLWGGAVMDCLASELSSPVPARSVATEEQR